MNAGDQPVWQADGQPVSMEPLGLRITLFALSVSVTRLIEPSRLAASLNGAVDTVLDALMRLEEAG